jgi:glucose/arabinose dehydrogenase
MKKFHTAGLCLLLLFLTSPPALLAQPPVISYQLLTMGLSVPVDIVNAGDGSNRLFIVEQSGIIKQWNGTSLSTFINIASQVLYGGERGLLSMAFHPGYNGTTNRYFFVYYTGLDSNITVTRYQTVIGNPNVGDTNTGTLIITIPHGIYNNHNGGKLNFGRDGYLYFATGDGGGANDIFNRAQNVQDLLGKMLRIDIDHPGPPEHPYYAIPPTNPFLANSAVKGEIINLGLRNPFRWSFDKLNGNMWIADVGQKAREEIDFRPADSIIKNNFGWHCYEGTIATPGVDTPCMLSGIAPYVKPVYEIIHASTVPPYYAITGGYVYRGTEYPNFRGYYISSEFYSGDVTLLWPNGSGGFNSSVQTGLQTYISSFGEAENGSLYVVSMYTQGLYKVIATGGSPLPVSLTSFKASHFNTYNELKWSIDEGGNLKKFLVQSSSDARDFTTIGNVSLNTGTNNYSYRHTTSTPATVYYRIGMEDKTGIIKYSGVQKLSGNSNILRIYPSVVTDGILNITLPEPAKMVQLVNNNGAIVFRRNLTGDMTELSVKLPQLSKGMYTVRILIGNEIMTGRVVIE